MRRQIEQLEQCRQSRVLVLATSSLELEILPALYDMLRRIGPSPRLDLLLYCRGGAVNAARRAALLLHDFTDRLAVIVPDRCESAGTIAALAAQEIVAGPAAIFSPIDPILETPSAAGEEPSAISAQDVRLFGQMAEQWFQLDPAEARAKALAALCESIFPTTLTAFYRATLEVEAICAELLSLGLPGATAAAKAEIADRLIYGHHSHGFALTGGDLGTLGLPVRRDEPAAALAWEIVSGLRASVGAGARQAPDEDWFDTVVATSAGVMRRRRSMAVPAPRWEAGDLE
ncbi:MAG TPA: hypothetical protein VN231_11260 [Allosphingosinicella sp.]|nr:hypothetical protein [Allosphingosinicella sp.]